MSARREYLAGLALGAVGAALVLLSVRQGWARVLTPNPAPLPAAAVSVRGQDLVPAAGALALAALAGLAAVIATRRGVRRLTGLLLAAFGVIIAVSVSLPVSDASVRAATQQTAASQAGSATAGGTGVAPGTVPGGAVPGVTTAGRVTHAGSPWQTAALTGALLILAAGLATAWRGGRWPAMPGRYERAAAPSAGQPAAPAGQPGARGTLADSAAVWDALSRGADPTGPADVR